MTINSLYHQDITCLDNDILLLGSKLICSCFVYMFQLTLFSRFIAKLPTSQAQIVNQSGLCVKLGQKRKHEPKSINMSIHLKSKVHNQFC